MLWSAGVNLLSRVGLGLFGMIQVLLIARSFGVSATSDAFMVASWVALFIWSAGDTVLLHSLVPYIVEIRTVQGEQAARRMLGRVFYWFLICLASVSVVLWVGARPAAKLLAAGFSDETSRLTAALLRDFVPSVFLGGLCAFFTSILFAAGRFSVAAVAVLLPDLGAIATLLGLTRSLGIRAPVLGFTLGVCVQVGMLAVALARYRLFPVPRVSPASETLELTRRVVPRLGGSALNRAIIGVDRFFASLVGAGAVSALAYSYRITQVPVSLAIAALGKTLMPWLSRAAAKGDVDALKAFVTRSIGYTVLFLVPLSLLFGCYNEAIVRLLYQRGSFTADATRVAAQVLICFSASMLFTALSAVFSGVFFACGDTRTPFRITVVSLGLNALLDYMFLQWLGVVGIAAATMVLSIASTVLLYRSLSKKLGGFDLSKVRTSGLRICAAAALVVLLYVVMEGWLGRNALSGNLIAMGVSSSALAILFVVACRLLRVHEVVELQRAVYRRAGWQR